MKDLNNQRFGRLTVLDKYIKFTNARNRKERKWLCRCDCGTEKYILERSLLYGNMSSCGCQKKEHDDMMQDFLTRIDGTSIDMIKSKKIPANNTSGVKGVGFSRGKWFAKIVFQKKQYHLGKYDTFEEAEKARKDAEELLFDGTAVHYEKWKRKADIDPSWAKENPVKILVSKKNTSELTVVFLPIIS